MLYQPHIQMCIRILTKSEEYLRRQLPHHHLHHLYYLYNLIVLNNRISILEYGTGWSSLIIYKALLFNKNKNNNNYYTRADNPYSLDIVDNSKKFLKIDEE